MPITADNVGRHELIGLDMEVIQSNDKSYIGKSGRIVSETKNTLVLQDQDGREARLIKSIMKFKVKIEKNEVSIDGSKIAYRPEDRTKKVK